MLLKLTIFLPLFSFVISGILSRIAEKNFADKFAQVFSTALLMVSAICALVIFFDVHHNHFSENITLISFISSGDFLANWSLKLDSLTAIMLVVVTLISALVHLYSISYMHEDKSIARFMSYLSLFTFFMLALVTADNFVQLFFGWEGVGVASYLLIGFWFKKPSANAAAIKAFIVNRIGDFGLVLAIAMIYLTFGSVEYEKVFAAANAGTTIDIICILLFIGAMGKSAQIGLHVWLADAMEGPTPVSALIHAATMVTAGVFLVARCSPLFELSEIALTTVTLVGATTALFAATIAITQNDIKKIIAYSTCSQLGYMFFACGISAYSAAIFHLATHAFFKALLFLGAGSVIHAMHHEQDIQKMGGIWKKIPITYAMMWIGSLALAGFPPFAGFYSKDVILEAAFMSHNPVGKLAFVMGISAAFLTAFYSWRLLFVAFHGKTRTGKHTFNHIHESPLSMLIPLFVLAFGSIFAGIFGDKIFHMVSAEGNFFDGAIFVAKANRNLLEEIHHAPFLVKILPLIVGIAAIVLAYVFYIKKTDLPQKLANSLRPLYRLSLNKWYFDEIYEIALVAPTKKLGDFFWRIIDIKFVDSIPNGAANFCKIMSARVSKLQSGYLYNYAMWMVFGLIVIVFFLISSFKQIGIF
ncbi:MAG: NADH-quinone oxidoreductase subunit L [Alphaproteobacteria bacterium RIFCSPLOWO2_01_FULL_40_26]|nr:MAG: NADH-quinone oxidoreductase subunit L [Alphaproteobacteria bacterium RIFCSPHIGHO2_02_FULL_40_34]OFW94430.1 MAG: NADH-quinone oxidoreductase subunit L [Alphaproteobacteria bacterium RIFCSPLOWO2_01_FULL_40_26]OFX09391.1 MAG: NADH-quinone oxidoreductase subunit L [Alphaproteobacteria bacterium RIFCSPLOWO2_02_FULL_40_19]OFX11323.1 MAG: NADH-quinone oxidoreductase subunit L [Alphaproteobacteria bacterium RIFCSPLOWO2_12_FULL_40_11]